MLYALAPMDGITDTTYRQIVKKVFETYKKKGDNLLLFTEFVSSDGLFHNFDGVKNHILYENKEKPLIAQIFWSNLDKLIYTMEYINDNYDFDGMELNIWCPSPKIMKLWAWSALLKDKEKTLEIVKTLSEKSTKPFSIKTRAWLNDEDKKEQKEFIIKISNYCNMISIHARTMKQSHSWEVDVDYVLDVKKKVNKNCKIIFNWWITKEKLSDKDFMKKMGKLDGLMIWQSAIWNPWIFVEHQPDWKEKKQIILEHLDLNIKYKWERKGLVEFRKFIWTYIKGIDNASKYRLELMQSQTLGEFKKVLDEI